MTGISLDPKPHPGRPNRLICQEIRIRVPKKSHLTFIVDSKGLQGDTMATSIDSHSPLVPGKNGRPKDLPPEFSTMEEMTEELIRLRRRVAELEAAQAKKEPNAFVKEKDLVRTFGAVFEAAHDAIFLKDLDLRYCLVNPAMETLFGMPASRIIGRTHSELFGPDADPLVDRYDQRVLSEEIVDQGYQSPHDQKERIFHVVKAPVRDRGGNITGVCGVARDISRRQALEERMARVRRLESIASLAGGIAHEFNNALTVICGKIEMLQMDYGDDSRMVAYIDAFNASTRRMVNLTRQLLAYARGGPCQPRKIFWKRFVAETVSAMGMDIDPGIVVVTKFEEDQAWVEADQTQIQMVISAILANAVEAINGEGRIEIRCGSGEMTPPEADGQTVCAPGTYVWMEVGDDGTGMDANTRNRVFEPFFTTKFQGRGLGMAAVYGIVKSHGGWIAIDSEPGLGTMVRMGLPASKNHPKKKARAQEGSA